MIEERDDPSNGQYQNSSFDMVSLWVSDSVKLLSAQGAVVPVTSRNSNFILNCLFQDLHQVRLAVDDDDFQYLRKETNAIGRM